MLDRPSRPQTPYHIGAATVYNDSDCADSFFAET
jgi:hypothetical protein